VGDVEMVGRQRVHRSQGRMGRLDTELERERERAAAATIDGVAEK
jgi:hypothetical protein